MMKKTGPSHAVGYKSSKKQDRYSLESNQCVCADGKGVRETARSRSKSSLTGPTSLEMLKPGDFTHDRGSVTITGKFLDILRLPDQLQSNVFSHDSYLSILFQVNFNRPLVVEWNRDHLKQVIAQPDIAIPQVALQFRNFAAWRRSVNMKASLLNPTRTRINARCSVGLMDVRRRETKVTFAPSFSQLSNVES